MRTGLLGSDTGNVYIYNAQTDTGYLLMDLDSDAANTYESGVIVLHADLSEFN